VDTEWRCESIPAQTYHPRPTLATHFPARRIRITNAEQGTIDYEVDYTFAFDIPCSKFDILLFVIRYSAAHDHKLARNLVAITISVLLD
jgi:hypothetical protein